jgi:hypothetical protein
VAKHNANPNITHINAIEGLISQVDGHLNALDLDATNSDEIYPYPLSKQKLRVFKVDSSPYVKAVGTEGARRATGVPTATPYTSAGVR